MRKGKMESETPPGAQAEQHPLEECLIPAQAHHAAFSVREIVPIFQT